MTTPTLYPLKDFSFVELAALARFEVWAPIDWTGFDAILSDTVTVIDERTPEQILEDALTQLRRAMTVLPAESVAAILVAYDEVLAQAFGRPDWHADPWAAKSIGFRVTDPELVMLGGPIALRHVLATARHGREHLLAHLEAAHGFQGVDEWPGHITGYAAHAAVHHTFDPAVR